MCEHGGKNALSCVFNKSSRGMMFATQPDLLCSVLPKLPPLVFDTHGYQKICSTGRCNVSMHASNKTCKPVPHPMPNVASSARHNNEKQGPPSRTMPLRRAPPAGSSLTTCKTSTCRGEAASERRRRRDDQRPTTLVPAISHIRPPSVYGRTDE